MGASNYHRLVVKLVTPNVTAGTPHLSAARLGDLVRQMVDMGTAGSEAIVVSSGFMAVGREALSFQALPKETPSKMSMLHDDGANSSKSEVTTAGPDDFDTEWLSLVLGLKVVDNHNKAIEHIGVHSTAHSDGILTETDVHAQRFVDEVDSAAVYVNASTRFTDGAQFGLGAEVAISTQRLHARRPMGLPELTNYKWMMRGDYTVRP